MAAWRRYAVKQFPCESHCFHCHALYFRTELRHIYHTPECRLAREEEVERVHAENAARLNASGRNVYVRQEKRT